MKTKKYILPAILLAFILILSFSSVQANAFTPLDKINNYDITITPNDDGTLNLVYHINWTVLNDDIDGPLSWIKVGVANKHISNFKNYSPDVIEEMSYYSDDGSFIRLDLNRDYYEGETIDFAFELTQSRIFTLNGDFVEFQFNPGWFDEIQIEKITVQWPKENIYFINTDLENENYYLWEQTLNYGETISVECRYDRTFFPNLNEEEDYISYEKEASSTAIRITLCFMLFFVAMIIVIRKVNIENSDGYDCYAGFTGRNLWYYYMFRPTYTGKNSKGENISTTRPTVASGGGGYSGGHSCACACACACAGGGRAGCSRKDFYDPSKDMDELINKLEQQ